MPPGASRHQSIRREVALLVLRMAACARYGKLIAPDEPWDLGHNDLDRTIYAGTAQRNCN